MKMTKTPFYVNNNNLFKILILRDIPKKGLYNLYLILSQKCGSTKLLNFVISVVGI